MSINLKRMVLLLSRMLETGSREDNAAASPQELKRRAAAFTLCQKAAEQGHTNGQYLLAFLYSIGLGAPRDAATAAYWYRQAAEQGHAEAQYLLGLMYYHGEGVEQNDVHAYLWLALAAAQLPTGTEATLAAQARDRVASTMTPAQQTAAQRLVRQWKPIPPDAVLL